MKTKLQMIGLMAVAASTALGVVVDGLTVSRKPKEGESARYKMQADVDFGGMALKAKFVVSEKVTKVEADGTYKVEQAQLEGKIDMNGQEQDLPSGNPSTTVYAKDGTVKEITGDQTTADTYRMANLGVVFDPGKPLNVGDTWSYDFKKDAKTGAVAAKGTYKLLAEEKVGSFDTLKIQVNVKESEGTDPAANDGTVWISKTDGSVVKMDQKWTNAPFPGAPAPINATVKMDREEAK